MKIKNKEIFIIPIPEGKPVKIVYEQSLPCPDNINFYCGHARSDPDDFLLTICPFKNCPSVIFTNSIIH